MLKEVSIEIIRKCPNNCVHCSSMSSIACNEIIPFSVYKNFIDSACKLNLKNVCLSGGEPFLHPELNKIVEYSCQKKINVIIYSSGIFYNNLNKYSSIPDGILRTIAPYLSKIIFNIEAATEETYNNIMGTQNCFPLLKESIENAKKYHIRCEAHTVPMKLNMNELDKIIDFCAQMGISKVSLLRLVPHGRAQKNQNILLTDDEFNSIKEAINVKYHKNDKVRIGVPLQLFSNERKCEAANGKLNIKYDGSVYPCEVFKNMNSSILFGYTPESIFDKNLDEIYLSSNYLNSVRKKLITFYEMKNCDNCGGQFFLNDKE